MEAEKRKDKERVRTVAPAFGAVDKACDGVFDLTVARHALIAVRSCGVAALLTIDAHTCVHDHVSNQKHKTIQSMFSINASAPLGFVSALG
jgi:hypothetical protein